MSSRCTTLIPIFGSGRARVCGEVRLLEKRKEFSKNNAFSHTKPGPLTGLPVATPSRRRPRPDHRTLLSLFEEELEEPAQLVQRLDRHAPGGWGDHVPSHVPTLHEMATACLEPRRRRRAEVADLIARLEEMRTATQALRPAVPSQFLCPITQEIMDDPVTTADGHAYERAAITRWLSDGRRDTSPATGARLPHKELAPAALRQLIREFVEANA